MTNEIANQRDIEIVTSEIRTICEQARMFALASAIEVGRRLVEAKEILAHGEWGVWLKERVNFSQTSANNYMRLYEEYGDRQTSLFGAELNSQAFGNLSYTKALKLLALPAEEREDFVKENDVEDMSTRELEKLIKERDEALKKAEEADGLKQAIEDANSRAEEYRKQAESEEKNKDSLQAEISALSEKLEKAKEAEKKAKAKLKEMKDNPSVPDEVMEKIRSEEKQAAQAETAKAIEERLEEANKRLAEADNAKKEAEEKVRASEEEIEALKKQVQMANPAVTEFKMLFNQAQECMEKLMKSLDEIEDKETAGKLKGAVVAMVGQYVRE